MDEATVRRGRRPWTAALTLFVLPLPVLILGCLAIAMPNASLDELGRADRPAPACGRIGGCAGTLAHRRDRQQALDVPPATPGPG